jgi:high-affinity Fe2+/Pb2+ permease
VEKSESENGTEGMTGTLAALVIGISLNTLGVVLVALRGIGWVGFALMVIGIVLMLSAIVRLTAAARRRQAGETPER